ncbi:ABC transporter [Plasmodium cynomolgi strain B]|uniref:ABC transporter n=1 Tax=Plasmodium cynomolgi (strain B) TaxID=1120755 RepID=K6UEJ2_PLACD|nr:ABC transporter [Plasmodium cynomolgi strain B]GAB68446.1 ABC transporter [Plasmodium cynomolgi strain B]
MMVVFEIVAILWMHSTRDKADDESNPLVGSSMRSKERFAHFFLFLCRGAAYHTHSENWVSSATRDGLQTGTVAMLHVRAGWWVTPIMLTGVASARPEKSPSMHTGLKINEFMIVPFVPLAPPSKSFRVGGEVHKGKFTKTIVFLSSGGGIPTI